MRRDALLAFGRLVMLAALLGYLSVQLHELGHWAVLQAFGFQPLMSFTGLVQYWERQPRDPTQWVKLSFPDGSEGWFHLASAPSPEQWVAALVAGPAMHPVLIFMGFFLHRLTRRAFLRDFGLLLVLFNALQWIGYSVRYFRGSRGDEDFVALFLGLPSFAVVVPLVLVYAVATFAGFRTIRGWRTRMKWLAALVLGGFLINVIVRVADEVVRSQIDLGNPLFQSVLGFSFPVLVVNIVAFLIFMVVLIVAGLMAQDASHESCYRFKDHDHISTLR